ARDGDLTAIRTRRARPVPRLRAIDAEVQHPRAGDTEPVRVDLGRIVTVVVGETGVDAHTRRGAVGRARRQEVVGAGEHRKRGRAGRVRVDHVQDGLFGRVG